jgi:hypothetical protein
MYALYMISWILIVLAQWNKSLQVDMLLHSDQKSAGRYVAPLRHIIMILSHSLLLLCNGVYLVEKLQKHIL